MGLCMRSTLSAGSRQRDVFLLLFCERLGVNHLSTWAKHTHAHKNTSALGVTLAKPCGKIEQRNKKKYKKVCNRTREKDSKKITCSKIARARKRKKWIEIKSERRKRKEEEERKPEIYTNKAKLRKQPSWRNGIAVSLAEFAAKCSPLLDLIWVVWLGRVRVHVLACSRVRLRRQFPC